MPTVDPRSFLPLTAVAFEILLTLGDSPRHGYDIMKTVERRTSGAMELHPGTLYRALARMLDEALIEEVHQRDPSRRAYRLTRLGADVARAEARRLASQVAIARARRWVKDPA